MSAHQRSILTITVQADAAVKRREAVKAPPADIRRYLKATGLMETRYIRMLSSLCAETYYLNKLNVSSIPLLLPQSWSLENLACGHVPMTLDIAKPTDLYVTGLQKRTLFLRHRLHLVTTSHECSHVAKEVPRSAQQTMNEGDAMAASPSQAEAVHQDLMASSQRSVPAMEVCFPCHSVFCSCDLCFFY